MIIFLIFSSKMSKIIVKVQNHSKKNGTLPKRKASRFFKPIHSVEEYLVCSSGYQSQAEASFRCIGADFKVIKAVGGRMQSPTNCAG